MAASPAASILPSSSIDRLSTSRVCFVFPMLSEDPDYRCDLYIVDLNSDGSDGSVLTPTFRVFGDFFDSVAFIVLGWTLYVVEGCGGCDDICRHTKTIFKCNLPSGSGSGVKLERSMLSRATNMYYIKTRPCAIPTPDGKRAVIFSSSVCNDRYGPRHRCDFELFDPSGGRKKRHKCQKLPQLQAFGASYFTINYSSFIDKSVFLVHCLEEQTYTIDLEAPAEERRWNRRLLFPQRFRRLMCPYQLIGDTICLTPFSVFDFAVHDVEGNRCYCYPDRPFPVDSPGKDSMIPLDVVNNPRDCRFCILRTWSEEYSDMEGEDKTVYVPHVILDVYRCDVVGCKMELVKEVREAGQTYELPCTKRVKSIKFCLEPQIFHGYFVHHFSWMD